MPEHRLLSLQVEYAHYDMDTATLAGLGFANDRTRDAIAAEYGQAMRDFLATTPSPSPSRRRKRS